MLAWRPFDYTSLQDLRRDIGAAGVDLPLSEDFAVLREPLQLYGKTVKNRLAIQPMEGFDGRPDGTPSDLTMRRYRRYAAGGAGLIWMESISTTANAKTCPRMSGITQRNAEVFRHLILEIRENAADGVPPFVVGQLTHCGRGAHLDELGFAGMNTPAFIACENPYLPRPNAATLTDDDLWGVIDDYVKAAALMKQAGFDCVDIRACHGYLLSEMLSAYTRKNSVFGGSFENRTRMMLTIIDRVNAEVGIPLAVRLNATDLVPYPYGWGMREDGSMTPDYTEPLRLGRILLDKGVRLLNISLGRNHCGHIQSPSDHPALYPREHQLCSIAFFQEQAALFKRALPEAAVMAGTFAWARQFVPHIAAGGIESGRYDLAGVARTALANPNFANEILREGALRADRCCLTCGKCGELIGRSASEGAPTGCVTRDPAFYLPYYRRHVRPAPPPAVSPENVYPNRLFELSSAPPF